MIINKRIFRDYKKNAVKYTALMLLIIVGLAVVVGLTGSVDSVEVDLLQLYDDNNLEDGNFSTAFKLTDDEIKDLEEEGATIEKSFFYDFEAAEDETLRLMEDRKDIDRFYALEGDLPEDEEDIFLEYHYADVHDYKLGDTITLGDQDFKVSGIGVAPDYTTCLQSVSETSPAPEKFGFGVISKDAVEELKKSDDLISTEYNYLFTLDQEANRDAFRKEVNDLEYLTSYMDDTDNPRIQQELQKIESQRGISLVFGIFFVLVMAYVLAVFTSGHMKNERETIGTFYAMGYTKNELIRHYIRTPLMILLIASLLGLGGGYFFITSVIGEHIAYYDLPEITARLLPYQYAFTIGLTLLLGLLFNLIVIRKHLAADPIELLTNRVKYNKLKTGAYKDRPFLRIFSKRIIQSNKEGYIALFAGIVLSVVLLVYGFSMYESLNAMPADSVDGVSYEHQYLLKLPETNDDFEGQRAMTLAMNGKERINGESLPVTINALEEDNTYFPFDAPKKDEVLVSRATAEKMDWKVGDTVTLVKQPENEEYEFKIDGIVDYTASLNMFLNMDSLNELLDYDEGSYNTVYSDEKEDIDGKDIASHNKKSDLIAASKGYIQAMQGTISSVMAGAIVLFALMLFLMLKIVIEKESYHISLIKILGYSDKEVSRLYFWNSMVIFVLSLLVGFPIGKAVMNYVIPVTMATMPVNVRVLLSPTFIGIMLLIMVVTYLVMGFFIRRKLKKIPYSVVLKSRD